VRQGSRRLRGKKEVGAFLKLKDEGHAARRKEGEKAGESSGE
jgi:hypothetical protein